MRQEIYQWMKDLAFFHVLTTAILHILPDKRYEQYVRLFMGLLLILLICTPVFAVVGKSQELLEGFRKNYSQEEQERMEAEAQGIRETFLKEAYESELKKQVEEILNEQKIFCGEIEVDMEKNLRVIIRFSEKITEKQKEAVQDGCERICGLGKDQYQILDPGDGVEGVGNSTSSGDTSAGGGLPVTQKSSKNANTQVSEKTRLESRLEELLSNVEGVGEVEVIIMTGDEGNTDGFSISSKNEVTGVLVAAQGAGSAVTVQNIQQAIMALFQIDAHKIRVMKMK